MKILDLPSNTRHKISKRRASDPNGLDPRFNAHWGNTLLLDIFAFTEIVLGDRVFCSVSSGFSIHYNG